MNLSLGACLGSLPGLVHLAAPANELEDGACKDPVGFLQEPWHPETLVVPPILVLHNEPRLHTPHSTMSNAEIPL